ncbi:translation initiation factor 3 subunit Eif3b [Acrasis kona]|uniref:Eukaryotic translation initiation factor 3 subunit B n=1 Tax=Acrasis kona TaxID=1008807 RepID=A0AAW2Z4W6_9EUKA
MDLSNVIAVDNLPITNKVEKLEVVLKQLFKLKAEANCIVLQMPQEDDGKTKGFAFCEFETAKMADKVIKELQGHVLSKSNKLYIVPFTEFDKYTNAKETEFKETPLVPLKEREFLRGWLQDEQARDQFLVRHYDTVGFFWNDVLNKPQLAHRHEKMSDSRVIWSPYGSYAVTWHDKGLGFWGGDKMTTQFSLRHQNVRLVDFSPRESFCITMNENVEDNVHVFDLLTQKKRATFTAPHGIAKSSFDGGGKWPFFKWSHDDKYMARLGNPNEADPRAPNYQDQLRDLANSLFIYDMTDPNVPLFNKKPLRIEGLREFAWMPSTGNKSPVLAYVAASDSDTTPSRVALLELPRNKEIRTQPFFKAINVKLVWSDTGDYLAVLVDREVTIKNQKTEHTTVEVFIMNQKGIPVEKIEFDDKIYEFKWEPKGKRFSAIHGDAHSALKRHLSFYELKNNNKGVCLKKFENKTIDKTFWSPRGINCVVANMRSASVPLEFYDVDDVEMVGLGEHFGMTNAQWDPTGRYFCSYVSAHFRSQENGYILWTFLGTKIDQTTFDKMYEFEWRPRPPTLLTGADLKKIQGKLPQLRKEYEKERSAAQQKVSQEVLKDRRRKWDEFQNIIKRLNDEYEQMKNKLVELRGYRDEDLVSVKVEMVEEVVSREEELVEE